MLVGACDLPPKNIGDSDSAGDSGNGDDGSACSEPEPDLECVSCDCVDGEWLCPAIGCADDGPGDSGGMDDGGACTPGDEMPADDGCNTCTCVEGAWACTQMACPTTIPLCDGTQPADPFEITAAAINGDSLDLTVAYSGGCAEHVFDTCWGGEWAESDPVQTSLTVTHDGMMDICDAYPSEDISLDLSGLREEYANAYGPTGTISINLDGWGSIDYSF